MHDANSNKSKNVRSDTAFSLRRTNVKTKLEWPAGSSWYKSLTTAARPSSNTVQITSVKDFCLFLPSAPKTSKASAIDLGLYANKAASLCTTGHNHTFPAGLIKSAHVKKNSKYVQVTGKLSVAGRYTGYQQFDCQVPKHASCKGYKSFVSIIDAEQDVFCLRCCNDNSCKTDKATLGCQALIPGTY
ncbi:hypothetical protein BGW37DRAFT_258053 [Umbelopsis sp. PMI_123]|nr:hypothetical protein BGW37DRAFT_258053 [Umbelopsis sp. PMI_123]